MINLRKQFLLLTTKISILLITICLALTLFACTDPNSNNPSNAPNDAWRTTYTLPDEDSVNARLIEVYGSKEKTYLLNNTIQRMPCPQDGAVMTFNMTYEVGEYARIVIEDAVNEINEVFTVINPNYKFAINYAPESSDFDSEYSIRMNITNNFSSPTVMGTAQISTGTYLSNFGITLKDTTLDDLRYLMLTFRHEFMHLLGAGDAYNNPQADKTTVMQNYNNTVYRYFSSSDVAFIDAYYRNPANNNTDAYIKNFISNYEHNNIHTQSLLLSQVVHYAMQKSNSSTLATQLEDKHYENSQELYTLLQKGLSINSTFGTQQVNFTELTYQEEHAPSSTYYGAFNPETGKYSHGKQTGSSGSAMSIPYRDLGNGLLLAMPNGTANMTLFVQTGNYVIALHAEGLILGTDGYYALRFSEIDISLLNACIIR